MQLEHSFTVPAGLDETWAHFNDIKSVARCFPGATVTEADADSFLGTVKVKLGLIALTYNGAGTFVEKDEVARRLVIDARGKDKRGNGTAGAVVTAVLVDAGKASTEVEVTTELTITGKAAQFGRGNVIKDVSDKMLGEFVTCLKQRLTSATFSGVEEGSTEVVAERAPEVEGSDGAQTPAGAGEGDVPMASAATGSGAGGAERLATRQAGTGNHAVAGASTTPRGAEDAIDLGSMVLPVLARAYWKPAVALLAGLLVIVFLLVRN